MMINTEVLERDSPPHAPFDDGGAFALHDGSTAVPSQHAPPGLAEMRGAIDAAKITVHYQPQIDVATGAIHAVEALIRWDDDEHGLLLPHEFLPLAVEAGLGASLTEFALSRLLSQLVLWKRFNFRFGGAINIPAAVISTPDFVDGLHRKVSRIGIRPIDVTIEIPAAIATADDIVVLENLLDLRLKGFGVAMDGFGNSNAALAQLECLPLTQVKTDRSLLIEAANRPKLRSSLKLGVARAKQNGLKAAAIGVERDEEWQLLSGLGFDIAQGYFIATPMVAELLPDWVVNWNRQVH